MPIMCWTCDQNRSFVQDGWGNASALATAHFRSSGGSAAFILAAQSASGTIGGEDPVADDTSTTHEIVVGAPSTIGTLEHVGDQDYFRVQLVAGQKYDMGMYAKYGGPNGVPLLDAYFEIRDAAGTVLASVDSNGPTTHNAVNSGYDAFTTFTAPYSGIFYINAKSYDEGVGDGNGHYVGDYELFVKPGGLEGPPSQPPSQSLFVTTTDTVANDLSTTSTIVANGRPVVSTIDAPGDQDFYKIEMVAGNVYRINQGFVLGGPSGVPLADAQFDIYDPSGKLVATVSGGGVLPGGLLISTVIAEADYTATVSGTHYISARSQNYINGDPFKGEGVGDYKLSVEGWKPFYDQNSPLYALDWGSQVDRTSRNPDGAEGPRTTGNAYSGVGYNEEGIQGKNVIYYYFAKQGEVYTSQDPANDVLTNMIASGFRDWEMRAFEMAMDKYEQVADLVYVEVHDKAKADFIFITYDGTPRAGILGRMSPPGTTNEGQAEFNRNGPGWDEANLKPGGFSFITLIHELGHGHGLAHPHDNGGRSGVMRGVVPEGAAFDYTTGAFDLNQGVFTMMSYEDGWQTSPYGNASTTAGYGYLSGLMAFDIAAIQDKYGVNEEWATGDDVYVMKDVNASGTMYESIWDAGGTDSIVYGGNRDATIDLRAASLKYEYGGGGWISYAHGIYGGFTIANGVTIENASSGGGNDKLIGNDVANRLSAGAGDDILLGGGGNDTLIGGAGKDTLTGGAGNDVFLYQSTGDSPIGLGRDVITDFARGDQIDLTAAGGRSFIGNQLFTGVAGQVRAVTLSGQTVIELDSNGDRLADLQIELTGEHQLDRLDFAGLGGTSTEGDDEIYGTSGSDTLNGLGGNDVLYGFAGSDTLNGGAGDDVLVGGLGRDFLTGGAGADLFRIVSFHDSTGSGRDKILDFQQGVDKIDLSALGGNWAFIGQGQFNGAGEQLRFVKTLTSTFIEADFDGDMVPDLQIEIAAPLNLTATDFVF
jgi:Ca2+-binding RTX toxin-like protein